MALLHRRVEPLIEIGRAGRIVVAVLLALALVGCDDAGPLRDLRSMPEASLYYPNTKVIREIATPQIDSPDGKSGAAFGHLLGANATPDELVAFYTEQLAARGWQPSVPGTGTSELRVVTWTNGTAIFRLGINRPESLTSEMQDALAGYSIEYDARVIGIYPSPT